MARGHLGQRLGVARRSKALGQKPGPSKDADGTLKKAVDKVMMAFGSKMCCVNIVFHGTIFVHFLKTS